MNTVLGVSLLLALTAPLTSDGQIVIRVLPAHFGVIDMIPTDRSGETDQNSEPSISIGTRGMHGKFFAHTFGSFIPSNGQLIIQNPYFTSTDGGIHWTEGGLFGDYDTTCDWSSAGTEYTAFLPVPSTLQLLSTPNPTTPGGNFSIVPAATYQPGGSPDQPWLKVVNAAGADHLYIGFNDLSKFPGPTASLRFSLDGGLTWNAPVIENSSPAAGQDSPAIRLAVSEDGKIVYALFQRWASQTASGDVQGSVVLVRDDNSGSGGFTALGSGTLVANNVSLPLQTALGVERIISSCDVSADPKEPNKVYVAYTEVVASSPLIRILSSSDSGQTFQQVFKTQIAASVPALAHLRQA